MVGIWRRREGGRSADCGDVSPVRVRLVIGAYPPSTGGAQVHTRELAHALRAGGAVVPEIATLWTETRSDYLLGSTLRLDTGTTTGDDQGIVVHEVGLQRRRWTDRVGAYAYLPLRSAGAAYFASALDYPADDSDLVHAVRLGREHLAVAAFRDARRRGVPFVLTPNHHPRWSGRRPDPVWRRLYRSADAVVALTQVERAMLADLGVASHRIAVAGIGPVLGEPADLTSLGLPERYLLFLGQQLPYKRLDLALDTLRLLGTRYRDVHLVAAGPPSRTAAKTVEERGLTGRVHLLGVVDVGTKTALLAGAQALLFPSEQEAFGGVLVEATAVGTPFVTRDLPQLREVAERLGWGAVVPGNAEAFTSATSSALDTPPSMHERQAASARVARDFSWRRLAADYQVLYERLLAGHA